MLPWLMFRLGGVPPETDTWNNQAIAFFRGGTTIVGDVKLKFT